MCYTSEELREGRFASCRPASFNNEHPDKKTSIKSLRMLYKVVKYLRQMDRVKINVMFALSSSCLKGFNGNVDVGSLDDYLQHRGPATESLTKVFTKQILKGLEYLHDREITHGNLTCITDNFCYLLPTNELWLLLAKILYLGII
ncbi:mitogen-activated protein kinase kinase kinase 3-like isoform X1 [Physella acuta]|uniref:mitogen-activated protein kinase kinase kinase 3-like isoform X1 n=1 Tax=Physella acuta TaxID=109671 RepID=UPI0027DE675A|nr:mitogen-activated protein kinase kinase kinase 3-like isoform X1 [Physella acuta]